MHLSLAPLQTYTDYHFRNAFQQVFGGVDGFYAPYLKLNTDGTIKSGPKIDVLPKNNPFAPVIPQVMACGADDFLLMARYLEDLGYDEVNWNMGCPYPMVTNRNLGAGMLNKPEELRKLLDEILPQLKSRLGIKMRMGLERTSEIMDMLPMLNDYPLTEIIIHARSAHQLYNGGCDHEQFTACIAETKHQLCYNGDINTLEEFQHLQQLFSGVDHWMIGRGAVTNPAIFDEIKSGKKSEEAIYHDQLIRFTDCLTESLSAYNNDKGYALQKLKSYWEYLSASVDEGHRLYRKLKKSRELGDFLEEVRYFLE